MFNWLVQTAKNVFNQITGSNASKAGKAPPAPKTAPAKPAPVAPKASTPTYSGATGFIGSVVNNVSQWINPASSAGKSSNAQAQAQAQARARAEAEARARAEAEARRKEELRRQVQGRLDNAWSTVKNIFGISSKKATDQAGAKKWSGNAHMVKIMPEIKNFKPIEPLAPVPLAPTPIWKDAQGNWHGQSEDIKSYEADVNRYNNEWKKYVDDRFKYSGLLAEYNQKEAVKAQQSSKVAETQKLLEAKAKDAKANIWGKIANVFTGGETQKVRDQIKNNIGEQNKNLSADAKIAQNQIESENKRWIGILQKKLETGDTEGFNKEFKKYDDYMASTSAQMNKTLYSEWGKQSAQQGFLNSTKQRGLITHGKDIATSGLGLALDVLDIPRRGINTVWNMVDPNRTRTYYDGTVKKDKVNNWGQAWSESYNQNVISQHQKQDYSLKPDEARKKWGSQYQDYKKNSGAWKNMSNVNPFMAGDTRFKENMSEQDFYKTMWARDQQDQSAYAGVGDFFADPLVFGSKIKKGLKWAGATGKETQAFKKVVKPSLVWSKDVAQSVTKNPKIASAIVGARFGKVGQAYDWLKAPSSATAKARWENNPEVRKAVEGHKLAKEQFDELAQTRFNKNFNKNLQLLPTKVKDAQGNMVRVEGADVLKQKLSELTPVQSRAFNHYVQARFDKTGKKLISPSNSWAGQEEYWKKLSRKDRNVVENLASAYHATTEKLYSIDRLSAKRGFKQIPDNMRTYYGTPYENKSGIKYQDRPMPEYQKRQGYVAKSFNHKSWSQRLEKMQKAFKVGDKFTSAKPVDKWVNPARKDPSFTQHKKVQFSNQTGEQLATSLEKRIAGSRKAYMKTVPENYLIKTEGKHLRGYAQNKNQRWVGKDGELNARYNSTIKERSGIKGYEADLADLASHSEFKKNGWEKAMEVAGMPKRVWTASVTRFRPAWYLNNIAYNVPASFAAGGKGVGEQYANILKAMKSEKTLAPEIIRELPKEVTNMSAKYGTIGTKIENISRASAYLAMRQAGVPKKEALTRMNDWLFDYSKTANWERPLKTVMPFWSFHKGLAMIAIKAPVKYPGSAFVIGTFKREFMEKPLAQIPDEEITWRDPVTGEEVTMNKRDMYRGKMKVPFTKDTWINSPFFPFGEESVSLHPILDLFEEHKSGLDKWGRDVTDKNFWRKAVARIPQLELVARAYELSDQKINPEKFIQRWVSENGSTKWAQGYDPSATNYKGELDNSKRFWDSARSFFGMPNVYNYDYEKSDYKKRMSDFQREYFAKNWDELDWNERDKQQKELAKKFGFTLDEVYKNWARYDTPETTAIKEQKQQAREAGNKFWTEYFTKDKGQQYIKDVQNGVKSERADFLREYMIKQLSSGGFADNRFLIGGGVIKKALMSLAQNIEYTKIIDSRKASYEQGKATGKFVWRGKVIDTGARPISQKASIVRRALATGDWSEYRRVYGSKSGKGLSEKARIVQEALRTGNWTAYRAKYGTKKSKTEAEIADMKFWKAYTDANPDDRKQMMIDNPQYNKRASWTQSDWDKWRIDNRAGQRDKIRKGGASLVDANIASATPKANEVWARRARNTYAPKVKWKTAK